MPLLNKQKFVKKQIPDDLDPNEEVFYSKLTQEIFRDYDEYFERTILCNSLVWTCYLTGKTGLTYGEALESEEKAIKAINNFPKVLEKAIVYLISLTKRGNLKDLMDDVFSFAKDRYFKGETLNLSITTHSKHVQCKILDVILPANSFDKTMDTDQNDDSPEKDGFLIDSSQIKYVIESQKHGKQTVKSAQLSRTKNLLTKDKIYTLIKLTCEYDSNLMWAMTDSAIEKYKINQTKFSEFFPGYPPRYEVCFGRGDFSRTNVLNRSGNQSLNKSSSSKSTSSSTTKTSNQPNKSQTNHNSKSKSKQAEENSTDSDESEIDENDVERQEFALRIIQIMDKKVVDMTDEEFSIWRDYTMDDDCKEMKQIEIEMEKIRQKEEKEKERERLKNEKNKQKEYLKELKKPKEDLECECLQEIPKPVPIKSKISQEMFGDAIMILEFLNNFGDLFDLKDDFPNGFNFDLLENALFSKSCDSALCNLLLFFLDSIFKCYDEETFDDTHVDSDSESTHEDMAEVENDDMGIETLYKDPFNEAKDRESVADLAEALFKLVKNSQGKNLIRIGLDVYTISEMLRLYFLTSGAQHTSKIKFWYQQRGGYTRMDETGIDFVLIEKNILKKLELMNVYELEPNEKLKILTCLCHQLMSQVRYRDLIEDNFSKLSQLKAQLRDLQWEEGRRLREETSERWKKKMQDRAKEKARLEEIKSSTNSKEKNQSLNNSELLASKEEEEKLVKESNKKREDFLKKEKHLLEEIFQLQIKCSMNPLGRDRFYRRYWVFKSLPGLFVEDDENLEFKSYFETIESNTNSETKLGIKLENGLSTDDKTNLNNDSDSTDGKENDPRLNNNENTNNNSINKSKLLNDSINNKQNDLDTVNDEIKWSFYYTPESIEQLIQNLNERGIRESELKQSIIDYREKINEHVTRSNFIITNLTMSQEDIEKSLRNCLKENVSNVLANSLIQNNCSSINLKNKRQAGKQQQALSAPVSQSNSSTQLSSNNYSNITSQEYMENDLKDKLIEIEEQIFIGSLGHLKVTDRLKWREALQNGKYDPQCVNLTWGDQTRPATEITNSTNTNKNLISSISSSQYSASNDTLISTDIHLAIVNNLAKVLLQIEQSVEKKFLRMPLGETLKTPDRKKAARNDESNASRFSVMLNWEKSLMNCTTLSQLFIHLQNLDESIAWSKSALNARCRFCRKKGDADRMLLCDKCDHGHHIYCLRPPLQSIPEGEWYCPECKPKKVEKTPRKMRKSFAANANDEMYSDEGENSQENNENEEEMNENDTEDNESLKQNVNNKGKKRKNISKIEEDNHLNGYEEDNLETENENNEDYENEQSNGKRKNTRAKKNKVNGNHLNGTGSKNSILSEEEAIINDSDEDDNEKRRSTRKRKLTAEKPIEENNMKNKKNTKLSSKSSSSLASTVSASSSITSTKDNISKRSSRTRSKNLNYIESDDFSANGTDDDSMTHSKRKRTKTSEKSPNSNEAYINNTNSRNLEMLSRIKQIEKILNDLMKHKDAWPFLKPVSKRQAPDYFEIIEKPMDFSTIKNNINNYKYDDYTNIVQDIRLVFENCRTYNEPDSDIYETGERMSNFFETQSKKAGLLDTKQLASPNSK